MAVFRTTGYDRTLLELRTMTVALAGAVKAHLMKAVEALETPGLQVDWRVQDNEIDQARDQIVNRSFEIMSLQQLRNQDLRWILGYQRMAQELERIADYACDVAELSELKPACDWSPEILNMARYLLTMFEDVLAVLKEEKEMSRDFDDQDDVLDLAYATLQKALVSESQNKNVNGELGLALVLARTLERIGDHVVNVAEMHLYVQTGQRRLGQ